MIIPRTRFKVSRPVPVADIRIQARTRRPRQSSYTPITDRIPICFSPAKYMHSSTRPATLITARTRGLSLIHI